MRVVIAGAGSGRPVHRPGAVRTTGTRCCSSTRTPTTSRRTPGPRRRVAAGGCLRAVRPRGGRPRGVHVVVAATGDDKANLVISLLAKTEFGVPRTVAPGQQPEERVDVQRVLGRRRRRLHAAPHDRADRGGREHRRPRPDLRLPAGEANMVEITLPEGSPFAGRASATSTGPDDTVLVAIIREERPLAPTRDDAIEAGDELLFITTIGAGGRAPGDLVAPTRQARPSPRPRTQETAATGHRSGARRRARVRRCRARRVRLHRPRAGRSACGRARGSRPSR